MTDSPEDDGFRELLTGEGSLEEMSPEVRAHALARLQFTQPEIEAMESEPSHERSSLLGEAQVRLVTFIHAMAGNPQSLKIMAEVIRKRKYQDRLAAAKAKLVKRSAP